MTMACLALWIVVATFWDGRETVFDEPTYATRQDCEEAISPYVPILHGEGRFPGQPIPEFVFECRYVELDLS